MGMVLLEPEPVQRWLDEHHGGDRLVAVTRVMTPTNYEASDLVTGPDDIGSTQVTRELFGLPREQQSPLLTRSAGLLVLTAANFYLLRLGGFKERIKQTSFHERRDQMTFAAHDVDVGKHRWRHWLIHGFPDGQYLLEPQVLGKGAKPSKIAPGSHAFLTALGDDVELRVSS